MLHLTQKQLVVSFFVVLVGSALVNSFALRIVRPLQSLAASMERVAVLDFSDSADHAGELTVPVAHTVRPLRWAHTALREVAAINKSFVAMANNLRCANHLCLPYTFASSGFCMK